MTISSKIKDNGIYLGYFTFTPDIDNNYDSFMRMQFHGALRYTDYVNMGDIVYGMYINDQLVKIGMAGGKLGWYGRQSTYTNISANERTNAMFRRKIGEMFNFDDVQIHVYAIQTPRIIDKYLDPISGTTICEEVSRARKVEKRWTNIAKFEGENLYLCTQN